MARQHSLVTAVSKGALRVALAVVQLDALEARIGHVFAQRSLLERALTHVSALSLDAKRSDSYQRLEFLGDHVLGLVVSEMLYQAFPLNDEGDLSRRLANLVRKESCAEVALEWGVGRFVRLGDGEAQSGGAQKNAILADVCEALIGAAFLDGGYAVAQSIVSLAWGPRMVKPVRPLRDAKTALQEWAQGRGLPTPLYMEISRTGPAHAPHFVIGVKIEGFAQIEAEGASKRIAEQSAAEAFLRARNLRSDEAV